MAVKKRVLFLAMHRPDRSPSQRFRFEQYLPYLNQNGIDTHFSFLISEKQDRVLYSEGNMLGKGMLLLQSVIKRLKDLQPEYDAVFVQREAFLTGSIFFESKLAKKAPVIFDFDDSIWIQDESANSKKYRWLKNPEKTSKIIALSSAAIAGNQYLADYAGKFNPHVYIIPTTIDTSAYIPSQSTSQKVIIGWSGSFSTLKHFENAIPALIKIREKYQGKVDFKVIGDATYSHEALGIQGKNWKMDSEIQDLNSFDIGIMPLPNDEWSRGKCGLKGLQYMALEIPAIMSPVGVNTEIIQDGVNGFLASTEKEWVEKLSLLIENPDLRKKLGKAGRQTVVEKYSVEANKHKYLEVFRKVLGDKHND